MITLQRRPVAAAVDCGAAQRVDACGELLMGPAGRLSHLYQQGAARIRLPAVHGSSPEAVLMNTAGGLTGGDRLNWRVAVADDAELLLTTAACERIYKADTRPCCYHSHLSAGAGARLDWLPQETILYDGARLSRRFDVHLASDACALLVETLLFGRHAMGERVDTLELDDRWRIERNGHLVHAEALRISTAAALRGSATLAGQRCLSTIIFCSKLSVEALELLRDRLRGLLAGFSTLCTGVSVMPGRLVLRLLGDDNLIQQRAVRGVISVLRPDRRPPRIWAA